MHHFTIILTLPDEWLDRRQIVTDVAASHLRIHGGVQLSGERLGLRRVTKSETQTVLTITYSLDAKCTTDQALDWAQTAEASTLRSISQAGIKCNFRLLVEPNITEKEGAVFGG